MQTTPVEQYRQIIAERTTSGAVVDDITTYHLEVGHNTADIRQTGAYITSVTLAKEDGQPVQVLFTPGNQDALRPVKLNASHAMMQMAYGDQHGPARNIDYQYVGGHGDDLYLQSVSPENEIQISRYFKLGPGSFQVKTSLLNPPTASPENPSMQRLGEHLYFDLPDGNAEGLRLVAKDGSNPLEDPTLLQQAMQGTFQYWPDPAGALEVIFPDTGKHLSVVTEAQVFDAQGEVTRPGEQGWMLWHRQGTDSICLEPVWGYSERGAAVDDEGFSLPVGSMAMLTTTISLI